MDFDHHQHPVPSLALKLVPSPTPREDLFIVPYNILYFPELFNLYLYCIIYCIACTFCLHVHLRTMCMQCLWGPEEGARFPGICVQPLIFYLLLDLIYS